MSLAPPTPTTGAGGRRRSGDLTNAPPPGASAPPAAGSKGQPAPESENVKVVCRIRPFNPRELQLHQKSLEGKQSWEQQPLRSIIEFSGKECIFLDHETTDNWVEKERFQFDNCFWSITDDQQKMDNSPYSNQEDVFEGIGHKILDHSWKGYNTCLLAYGQTGSGKTYSMMGPDASAEDPGIIPRLCKKLFEDLERLTEEASRQSENYITMYKVDVRYMELYNEMAKDLLWSLSTLPSDVKNKTNPDNMKIRSSPAAGTFVEHLTSIEVDTWQRCVDLINKGNSSRSVAATKMNERSSRSHAIFKITVTQITQTVPKKQFEKPVESTREACINLVDLAGSERVRKSGATGDRLVEATNINKSLLTLKRVIDTLVDNATQRKKNLPPYRDSHLTSLLKDSLGGNSKTIMLVCVSPHLDNAEESLLSLRYASRARQIVNSVRVNEDAAGRKLLELEDELERMRQELNSANSPEMIDQLKNQIAEHESSIHSMEAEVEQQQERIRQFKEAKEKENRSRHAMAFYNLHKLAQARLKKDEAMEEQNRLARKLSMVRHEKEDLTVRQQTAEKEQERLRDSIESHKQQAEDLDKEIDFWKAKNYKLEMYKAELLRNIEDQEREIQKKKEEKYARMFLSKFESAKIRQEFDRQMREQEQKHKDELDAIIIESQKKYEALIKTCVDREEELEAERKQLQTQLTQIKNDLKQMEQERTSQISNLEKEVAYLRKEKSQKHDENKHRLEQTIKDWDTKYDTMVHEMQQQHSKLCEDWEQRHFQDVSNEEEKFAQAKAQFKADLEQTQQKWDQLASQAEEEWEKKWKKANDEWQARLQSKVQHNQELKSHLKSVEAKELKYSALLHRVTAVLETAPEEGPEDYMELLKLIKTFQQEYTANQPSKYKLQQLLRGENLKFRCQRAPVVGCEDSKENGDHNESSVSLMGADNSTALRSRSPRLRAAASPTVSARRSPMRTK